MSYPPQDYNITAENGSKFAVTALSARIGAMISFIVAVAVFQTNNTKIDTGHVYTLKDFRSYEYGFWVALIGLGYTVLQIPLAMHYVLRKKHLIINTYAFLKFDFYADKMVATAVGAAFGATVDLKNQRWQEEEEEEEDDDNAKLQSFLSVTYIAAAFLLVGSISCWISSLHSSLLLSHKLITQQQF